MVKRPWGHTLFTLILSLPLLIALSLIIYWILPNHLSTQTRLLIISVLLAIYGIAFTSIRGRLAPFADRFRPEEEEESPLDVLQHELSTFHNIASLGTGNLATVYRARHPSKNRDVAIKILAREYTEEERVRQRFLREAQILKYLDHPHIVDIHHYGESDGILYIVMQYLDGIDLGELLREQGTVSVPETLRILGDISGALDYIHSQNVIHRDVKPANIMILKADQKAMLMDFGLAKSLELTWLTHTGMLGTFAYMSPEQIEERIDIDGRVDVYALGATAYHMLTGQPPFSEETIGQLLLNHIQAPPPDPRGVNPAIPDRVASAVMKALSKNPDERFATAGEFVAAMET